MAQQHKYAVVDWQVEEGKGLRDEVYDRSMRRALLGEIRERAGYCRGGSGRGAEKIFKNTNADEDKGK